MSNYPLKWSIDDFKVPHWSKWTREFLPSQRVDPNFQRMIESQVPNTRWDTDVISDSNVDSFWYLGIPDLAYPKYKFHLERSFAYRYFDWTGSFVKQAEDVCRRSSLPPSPPSLLLLVADSIRREEYVNLRGQAVIAVQQREGPFANNIQNEQQYIDADNILHESVDAFLRRKFKELCE